MAWTIVETPNAKYVLLFSFHFISITEKPPMDFDALVLESGSVKPKDVTASWQYENVVAQAVEKGKQVWLTDAPPNKKSVARRALAEFLYFAVPALAGLSLAESAKKEKIGRRAFLKKSLGIGVLFAPWAAETALVASRYHKSEIENHAGWVAAARKSEISSGFGAVEARNILTAEKTEGFLAPMLKKELGRKPVIAMVWAPAHFGIKELLENPEKRRVLLRKHDLGKYLRTGYHESFRLLLDREGGAKVIEVFSDSFPAQKKVSGKARLQTKTAAMSRRDFFRRAFRQRA